MHNIPINERIIVALDVETAEQAKAIVLQCENHTRYFKIGLQLFLSSWFEMVDWLVARDCKVMLDLKFFDIPETVKKAVLQIKERGVSLATIHGNDPIIRAAVEAKESGSRDNSQERLQLLSVTVLTSFGEEDMREMGMTQSIADLVAFRARRALALGCDGVVSSGLEAERMRNELGEKLLIVTPGIRPGANIYDNSDEQKRIVTAGAAIKNGADHVVVGRPITMADNPAGIIAAMQKEIMEEN